MIDPVVALKLLSLTFWAWIFWKLGRSAIRAFTKAAEPFDIVNATYVGFGIVTTAFNARGFVLAAPPASPANQAWLAVAYVLELALQVVVLRIDVWVRHEPN